MNGLTTLPGPPLAGTAARVPVTLVQAGPEERGQVLRLFDAIVTADPDYAPVVTAGDQSLSDWFSRKGVETTLLAVSAGQVVGHAGIRRNHRLPGGKVTPPERGTEMCRVGVHPRWQRLGIATLLVSTVHQRHGATLWATCHDGYGSHTLMAGLGWQPYTPVWWGDDPRPGVCLFAPPRLPEATP